MTFFDTTRTTGSHNSGFFSTLVARLTAWNDARLTRRALAALSDHELADIGLNRCDIDDIARSAN